MVTVVSSTTRRSAESIGQSFKTIFSRLQNVSAGKELDEEGEKLNDVEKALNRVGIATRDSIDKWRDASDIFDEVGSKWKTMSDTAKSQVATALGGTRQRENLIVLFENWDKVRQATEKSTNAAGTAEKKYSIYLESIDAKINQFIATWEQLVNNLNQSDTFAGVVELGTHILSLVDKLHLVEIAVDGAVSGFVLFGGAKVLGNIDKVTQAVNNLYATIKTIPANIGKAFYNIEQLQSTIKGIFTNIGTGSFKGIQSLISTLKGKGLSGVGSVFTKGISESNIQGLETLKKYTDDYVKETAENLKNAKDKWQEMFDAVSKGATVTKSGLVASDTALKVAEDAVTQAQIESTIATEAQTIATNQLYLAKFRLYAGTILLATGIILATKALYDFFEVTEKEHWDAFSDAKDSVNETEQSIGSLNDELETTASRIKELEGKKDLSLTESNELADLKQKNRLLEQQIDLKERLLKIQQETAAKEAMDALTDMNDYESINKEAGEDAKVNLTGSIKEHIDLLNQYKEQIAEIENQMANPNISIAEYNKLKKSHEELTNTLNEESTSTNDLISKAFEYKSVLSENIPEQKQLIDIINNLADSYLLATDAVGYFNDKIEDISSLNIDTTEYVNAVNNLINDLVSTSQGHNILKEMGFNEDAIKDMQDNFEGFLAGTLDDEEVEQFFEKLKELIKNKVINVKVNLEPEQTSVDTALTSIEGTEKKVKSLKGAFDDLSDSGAISAATIKDIRSEFGKLSNIEEYTDKLMDANLSTSELKQITVDMMNDYINEEEILDGLTGKQQEYMLSILKSAGYTISNSANLQANTKAKVDNWIATKDLSKVSGDDLVKALNLSGQEAIYAKLELFNLQSQMIATSNQEMNFSQQMTALKDLAVQAGLTSAQISGIFNEDFTVDQTSIRQEMQATGKSYEEVAISLYRNRLKAIQNTITNKTPTVTGYTPPSSGSGSSESSDDAVKKAFEAELKALDHDYEMGYISRREYYDKLKALDAKYYKGNAKYLEEHNSNLEKMRDLQEQIYNDNQDALDVQIEILEAQGNKEEEIIALLQQKKENAHGWAEALRAAGVTEDSEMIKNAQADYRDISEEIKQYQKDVVDNAIEQKEKESEYLEAIGKLELQTELEINKEKLDIINEYAKKGYLTEKEYMEQWIDLVNERKEVLQSMYEIAKDYNVKIIEEQIDALEKQKEEESKQYEERIKQIQEQLDLLDEEETKRDKILDLQEKQLALAKANSQKSIQIYREGIGFVWESDPDELRNAQKDYNDTKRDYEKWKLEQQLNDEIEALQNAKEAVEDSFDAQIDKLNELKDKWEDALDISDEVDGLTKELKRMLLNGEMSFDEMSDILDEFTQSYLDNLDEIENRTENVFKKSPIEQENISNTGKTWYVNKNGQAPSQASIGDKIITTNGVYQIVAPNTQGASYNPETKRWSKQLTDVKQVISDSQWGTEVLTKSVKTNSDYLNANTDSNIDLDKNISKNSNAIGNNIYSNNKLKSSIDGLNDTIQNTDFTIGSNSTGNGSSGSGSSGSGSSGSGSNSSNSGSSGGTSSVQKYIDRLPADAPYREDPNNLLPSTQDIAMFEIAKYLSKVYAEQGEAEYENIRTTYNKIWAGINTFATGTYSSPKGLALIDEEGAELTVRPNSQGRLDYLGLGTGVVPADLTKKIIDIATNPYQFFEDEFGKITQRYGAYNTANTQQPIQISIGDIQLYGVQDTDRLSKAIISNLPNKIIKDLYRR